MITITPEPRHTQAPHTTCRIFVTPHATAAYRARIYAGASEALAEREIEAALRHPLFTCQSCDGLLTLWGCRNRSGFAFLVATDPGDLEAPFLLVRTVGPAWFWKEARRYWQALGVNKPLHGGKQ